MFGLPHQDLAQAREDLHQVLALEAEHLSYYQLTLEPSTPFHALPPPLPDDDLCMDMQLQGLEMLAAAGFHHYEVAAHARPGRGCRHNLNYWTFGDYLGIGAGAHGKSTSLARGRVCRYAKPRHPEAYLQALALAGTPPCRHPAPRRPLGEDDLVLEFAMNALRLRAGFELSLFQDRTGLDPECLASHLARARRLGLAELKDQQVRPTELGRWFLNDLIACFMAD